MKKLKFSDLVLKFIREKNFLVCENQLFELSEGYWRRVPFEEIQKRFRYHLSEEENLLVSSAMLTELYRRIITDVTFEVPLESLLHENYILCNNGMVDLMSLRVSGKDDQKKFMYRAAFSFEEKAKQEDAPEFQKFLDVSLGGDEKKKILLYQILGYCIADTTPAEFFFVLLGKPGTGKSVLLKLLGRVVGEENITSMPFNRLGSRFNVGRLAGMKLNICSELNSEKLKNIDLIKAIISGERIMGEYKGEAPFEFTPRAKLVCAGNVLPQIPETAGADAILRRLVVLRFTEKVPEEWRDPELLEKLWQERDVIFSVALKEFKNLRRQNFHFEVPEDSKDYIECLSAGNEAVETFVQENCKLSADGRIHLCVLWDAFLNYVDENGLDVKLSKTQFSQEIGMIDGVRRTRFRENGRSLRGFQGIDIGRSTEAREALFSLENKKTAERTGTGTVNYEKQK